MSPVRIDLSTVPQDFKHWADLLAAKLQSIFVQHLGVVQDLTDFDADKVQFESLLQRHVMSGFAVPFGWTVNCQTGESHVWPDVELIPIDGLLACKITRRTYSIEIEVLSN